MNTMKTLGRALLALTLLLSVTIAPVPAAALTSARSVTANFSAVGSGNPLLLRNNEQFTYQVLSGQAGTQANKTVLQKSCDGSNFGDFSVPISTTNNSSGGTFSATIAVENCAGGRVWVRFAVATYTSGASSTTITEIDNVVSSLYNNSNESVMDVLDGGVQQNGYEKLSADNLQVSSSVTSGFTLSLGGAYTTAQIQAKTPSRAGILVFNTTLGNVCISTGTTIQGYKLAGTASTTCQ